MVGEQRTTTVVADVRGTDTLDGLIVTPRSRRELSDLVHIIRSVAGDNAHLSGAAVRVPAFEADLLLADMPRIDLRWSSEARLLAENRAWIKRVHPPGLHRIREILSGGEPVARHALGDVDALKILDPHQVVNVAAMTIPDGFGLCVFDEQGAGKTVMLIFAFDVLAERDEVDLALIVAPKSMVPEWPCDFERFRGDLYRVEVASGSRREKRAALGRRPDVVVTNFETVVSMEAVFRSLLASHRRRAVFVVDESFYAKSLDAKRTRALRRLREYCGRAFVLCGTPAPNSPEDLVQQFNLVDFGMTFDQVALPDTREAMAPVVSAAIEGRGAYTRHLKADVLPTLPVKRFHRVLVPMEGVQRRLYESTLNDLIVDLDATDDVGFKRRYGSFLARRSALIQICSNPRGVSPEYAGVPAKIGALDQLVDDLVRRRREKVVLWSFFTGSVEAIFERYRALGAVRYDGFIQDVSVRRDAVRRFQEDNETMLFIGNPAAAGAGLTLHRSRYVIYESMSNQAAHYLQSLDRVHRRGQTRDVEYLILLCQNSIELQEYDRLIRKERAAQALLGDIVDEPITRQSLLSELSDARRLLEDS